MIPGSNLVLLAGLTMVAIGLFIAFVGWLKEERKEIYQVKK